MTPDAAALWLAPRPAAFSFLQARELGIPIRTLNGWPPRGTTPLAASPPRSFSCATARESVTSRRRAVRVKHDDDKRILSWQPSSSSRSRGNLEPMP